jgi:hypothetical protein
MADGVNSIKNPDFSAGKVNPSRWNWSDESGGVQWQRGRPGGPAESGGVVITSDRAGGTAHWSQVVICKPGDSYRIEATAACELEADDESAGCVLRVQPFGEGRPVGERLVTPGVHRASEPVAIRTYFEAPEGIRRLAISIGLVKARGIACIHHVRFIRILEPDALSHVMAVPPPSFACPPPRVVKDVCVCSDRAADRQITHLLGGFFGENRVHAVLPAELSSAAMKTDALLLPDPTPPMSIRSLSSLKKLATDRIVVISLPAFATLTRGTVTLRRIEQDDDPIHAKVIYANHATCGFALWDAFPYAWTGRRIGGLVQNQFHRTKTFKEFCHKHGFETLLASLCDRDATSDRAICLHHRTERGGLFVLDIEPVETASSTFGEPAPAMHLLLSILGRTQTGPGQYVVPVSKEAELRDMIREMKWRFPYFAVHDADVPAEEVTEQLVTIGREDQSYGLPLKPKPVIIVRSGLTSGDAESVYGTFLWFKHLIRYEPFACPYASRLASRFRLAWVPCAAPWESHDGWRPTGMQAAPTAIQAEDGQVAALIDVISRPVNRVRVVVPSDQDDYAPYSTWLPQLAEAFAGKGPFTLSVEDGAPFTDRDAFSWRWMRYDVQVVADAGAFESEPYRAVMAAGGHAVRIELPGNSADFAAQSILRTGLTVMLLEHVIGLQYGLLAINRQDHVIHFDGFPPVGPGKALIVDRRDPMLRASTSQAG